ncbi:hypothetical protein L2719_11945 [Shewanella schlegeliana]|uniref:Uncharacterized protein n=1 Tax=Shewanella schlegeliana TaxID=190308 RepID=A0ABS1STC6_9GAMM|nr:hypothetical protein [Shewanella schlegeliana]MBL4911788.1 hypothetical protein [Shewanella schlegeliana]MCL1110259.1 hypothetical protein [Shewanella schlegeliana]GIU35891.1 hypothetical protein TUM4433_33910 [Shewanella schlegeliana]
MGAAELSIVALIAVVVVVSYLSIYPKVAGSNINRLLWCDIAISAFVLTLVGIKYWGSGQEFSLLLLDVNWFWFTLIVYLIIEVPMAMWYAKKHNITMDSDDK